jgi:hypothetical protein
MDYISHGFWSYIFFHKIKRPLLAVVFGLAPDTFSWGIYAVYKLTTGGKFGKPVLAEIPDWTFTLYNISHSLFVAGAAILLVYALLRKFPLYMLAWPIAVVMDLLTHTRNYLPTPFLWPVSDYTFAGISWASRWFIVINYALIALLMTLILYKRKRGN